MEYDNTDFSSLKGFSIYFRSAGHQSNTSIYFVDSYGWECPPPPYAVEFNDQNKTIVNKNNELVLKKGKKDNLRKEKITKVFEAEAKYNLCLVKCDNSGKEE